MRHVTKMAAVSAIALSLTTMAAPAQALVSDTNAESNNVTNTVAHIQLSNKDDMDAVRETGSGAVHVTSCTGTLISPQWVISATHCVGEGLDEYYGNATFGTTDTGQSYKIDDVKTHSNQDDMALFHLEKPVNDIKPLKLWDTVLQEEKKGQAYGWGKPADQDPLKNLNMLNGTMSPTIVRGDPFAHMDTNEVVFDGGYSIKGDSGSPFVIDDALYGVLSMGTIPEQGEESHGLYMPVAQYKEWIEDTIKQNDSFISTPGADPKNNQPQENSKTVNAQIPTEEDVNSKDKSSVSHVSQSSSSKDTSTDKGTQSDSDRTTDATVINTPSEQGSYTDIPIDGNVAENSIEDSSISSSLQEDNDQDELGDVAVGPTVKTGGNVEQRSFLSKIKALL